jgi:hypothetical protein
MENAMSNSNTEDKSFREMFGLIVEKEKLTQSRPAKRDEWAHREGAATTSLGDKLAEAARGLK